MQVPDAAVYACVPTLAGCLLWIGRQFVMDVISSRGPRGEKGDPGPGMTVRDYKEFSSFLIGQLNGRYLMAGEARERFAALESKLDDLRLSVALHLRLEENSNEQRVIESRSGTIT
jgi:hypothetical protein